MGYIFDYRTWLRSTKNLEPISSVMPAQQAKLTRFTSKA